MPSASRSHHVAAGTRARPLLEIIPDNRFIVFHGSEHEAASCKLSGVVRLTTSEPMTISKPKIRLEGNRKISWWYLGSLSAGEVVDKKTFWNEERKLGGIETPHKVKAGVIQWAFEFHLDPSMPESVEGLQSTYLIYQLQASVSRQGWNSKDLLAHERIRIVRTLGAESLETTRSRINSDVWANKIAYSISIPSDAVVFGTSITADVELSPIKKGLKMGKVDLRLLETIVKRIQLSEMPDSRDRTKSDELEVAKAEIEFPEQSKVLYDDETPDNPAMDDEMYRFKATLPLPTSLNNCRQDVDSHPISITHKFKLMVNLHNPEGHISQLVCRLPVKIFISPNLPLNESNQVCRPDNGITDETLNSTETTLSAPPQYGQHQLDELFSDIDPNGHRTRAPSPTASPSASGLQSRSISPSLSHDNLQSLGNTALLQSNGSPTEPQYHGLPPNLLQSRLASLQERGPTPRRSPVASAPTSRRGSHGNEQAGDVRRSDYDMNNLSRVPSYNHAVQASGAVTPYLQGPPTYFEVTSQPSSPNQHPELDAIVDSRQDLVTNGITDLDLSREVTLRQPPPAFNSDRTAAIPSHSEGGPPQYRARGTQNQDVR